MYLNIFTFFQFIYKVSQYLSSKSQYNVSSTKSVYYKIYIWQFKDLKFSDRFCSGFLFIFDPQHYYFKHVCIFYNKILSVYFRGEIHIYFSSPKYIRALRLGRYSPAEYGEAYIFKVWIIMFKMIKYIGRDYTHKIDILDHKAEKKICGEVLLTVQYENNSKS